MKVRKEARKEATTLEATETAEATKAPKKTSRKRKVAYGVLGVVVLANLMHGCGGNTETSEPTPTPEPTVTQEAEPELEVVEPVPAEITDHMLASQPGVYRTGNAAAVQDPDTGLYAVAIEVTVDGEPEVIVMGRESLEPGPARQWTVDPDAEDALPRVPRAMDDAESRTLITGPAYEAAEQAVTD